MKFEERKSKARAEVVLFLDSFAPPRGLSDDAMKSQVSNISDAFARRLPVTDVEQFGANLQKTFTAIRDHHKGYAWPVQSEFVDAMPKGHVASASKVEAYQTDEKQMIARRMNASAPAPESWVWGPGSWSLVSGGFVSREVMDGYRRSSIRTHRAIFSDDSYGMLQSRYGDIVGPYFASGGAA